LVVNVGNAIHLSARAGWNKLIYVEILLPSQHKTVCPEAFAPVWKFPVGSYGGPLHDGSN
jgi:hypothetical protein